MNTYLSKLIVLLPLFLSASCEREKANIDLGDADLTKLTHRVLEKEGISHELNQTSISFDGSDKEQVLGQYQQIRKGHTKLTFEDPEVRKFFYSLLQDADIKYLEAEPSGDGSVLFWPENQETVTELLSKTYSFKA